MQNLTSMENEMIGNTDTGALFGHKSQTNMSEIMYYLEEMYSMNDLNDMEEDIYLRLSWGEKVSKKELKYIKNNIESYFFVKF